MECKQNEVSKASLKSEGRVLGSTVQKTTRYTGSSKQALQLINIPGQWEEQQSQLQLHYKTNDKLAGHSCFGVFFFLLAPTTLLVFNTAIF